MKKLMIAAAAAAMIGGVQASTCINEKVCVKDPCTGEKVCAEVCGGGTAHKVAISLKTTTLKGKKSSAKCADDCTYWREQKTVKINGLLWQFLDDCNGCIPFGLNSAFWTDAGALDVEFALGVGLNDVSPYVDTGVQMQMEIYLKGDAEAQAAYLDMVSKIGPMEGNREPVLAPPLSEAQTERYTELLLKVENLVWQEVDKYIKGEEPIENWDNVIATIKADAEEMEEIYNEAWNAALGK